MYNNVKRNLSLASSIVTIFAGALGSLAGFIVLTSLSYVSYTAYYGSAILLASALLGLGITLIVLGTKFSRSPVKPDGSFVNRKKADIAQCVLLGVFIFITTLCFDVFDYALYESPLDLDTVMLFAVFGFLVAFPALGLRIASTCLKDVVSLPSQKQPYQPVSHNNGQSQTPSSESDGDASQVKFEQKIAELKRLKDLEFISQEQYDKAVVKLIEDFVK